MEVLVAARVRPLLREDEHEAALQCGEKHIGLPDGSKMETHKVFLHTSTNEQVHAHTTVTLVHSFVRGCNIALILAGEARSGRAHTLTGSGTDSSGLLSLFLADLFEIRGRAGGGLSDARVWLSAWQTSPTGISDLLSPDGRATSLGVGGDAAAALQSVGRQEIGRLGDTAALIRSALSIRNLDANVMLTFRIEMESGEGNLHREAQFVMLPDIAPLGATSAYGRPASAIDNLQKPIFSIAKLIHNASQGRLYPQTLARLADATLMTRQTSELFTANCQTAVIFTLKPFYTSGCAAAANLAADLRKVYTYPVVNTKIARGLIRLLRGQLSVFKQQALAKDSKTKAKASPATEQSIVMLEDVIADVSRRLEESKAKGKKLEDLNHELTQQALDKERERVEASRELVATKLRLAEYEEAAESKLFELRSKLLQVQDDLMTARATEEAATKALKNAEEEANQAATRLVAIEQDRATILSVIDDANKHFSTHDRELETIMSITERAVEAKITALRERDQFRAQLGVLSGQRDLAASATVQTENEIRRAKQDLSNLRDQVTQASATSEHLCEQMKRLKTRLDSSPSGTRSNPSDFTSGEHDTSLLRHRISTLEKEKQLMEETHHALLSHLRRFIVQHIKDVLQHMSIAAAVQQDSTLPEALEKDVRTLLADVRDTYETRESQLRVELDNARGEHAQLLAIHQRLHGCYRALRRRALDASLSLGSAEEYSGVEVNETAEVERLRRLLATMEAARMKPDRSERHDHQPELKATSESNSESIANLRHQIHLFTTKTQRKLEAEKAALLASRAAAEQRVKHLQLFIETTLSKQRPKNRK